MWGFVCLTINFQLFTAQTAALFSTLRACSRKPLETQIKTRSAKELSGNYSNEKSEKFSHLERSLKKADSQAGKLRNLLYQKLIKIYANMYCVRKRRSSESRSTEWLKNYELVFPRRTFFLFFVGKWTKCSRACDYGDEHEADSSTCPFQWWGSDRLLLLLQEQMEKFFEKKLLNHN